MEATAVNAGVIPAGGSYSTEAYNVTRGMAGYFSLQWTVTGDGTMKAEVLVSNDGVIFNKSDPDITTGQTKISGVNGTNMASFDVTPCKQFRLRFSETGSTHEIAVAAKMIAI